jgi:hypothetical protein
MLLTGCSPVYETQYSYEPPKSKAGRMCAAQCIQNEENCKQLCQLREDVCITKSKQDALYQYEVYKAQQQSQNRPIIKTPENFDRAHSCYQVCGCTSVYNTCFERCGGQVATTQGCTAFCKSI